MKSAVLYVRVSSKRQEDEGFSIPAQINLLTEYSKKNNIKIEKIFEESKSAGKAGRKAYNEMLEYITKHNIKDVLVEKTDRIYRNFKDYVVLEDYDLTIHLVKEGTILNKESKSHEKLVHGFKVLLAKNYLDNLSEEVKKGLTEKVKQGYYPQKAPVGYLNIKDSRLNKKIIIPDINKAPYIKRLFNLYSTGVYSVETLRKMLYEEGFNHNGKPYSKARLLFVLKDIFYTGKFIYNGIIYEGKHEPIIEKDLFNKVQKLFNQSKARTHEVEFAYAGLLTCGHCGCQLTAELKKGKYIYYHCTGKRGGNCKKDYIREEQIEEVFLELIDKIPAPETGIFEDIRKASREMQQMKVDFEHTSIDEFEKQIKRLTTRLSNLYEDYVDRIISKETYEEKHALWYNEKEKLIDKLHNINNASKKFDEGSNLLENFCKHARQEFLRATAKEKQMILKMLGSNFSYKDGKVSIVLTSVFNYLLNLPFGYYGAGNCPKLELFKVVNFLKENLSDDVIAGLRVFKKIA